ncbi:uncharacterized protein si:ch211-167j6.3 isoform X2 [Ictalurus punctatus]|uniref:Uncharacterized protein si:ch211-167j6.3 isoform X2 n=1 Tax=Ictalurus punctatus TaxID=7998 RepID=A0A979F3Q2_ICTPU|nr:uncharacterized protein si:ch211-167j6.3 isoform X2 [Ictalurus punctatus]
MDSPHDDKDVQDLSKRLKDATSKLQRVKSEREEVNMEVHQRREDMDRRMLLLLHVDNRVCDALIELEAAKQKKQTLVQLIESLSTHTWETKLSSVSVSVMQEKVEVLEEEENKLKLQCEQVKKALDDVQESK